MPPRRTKKSSPAPRTTKKTRTKKTAPPAREATPPPPPPPPPPPRVMNSFERFCSILYDYESQKKENKRLGITDPVISRICDMSFDFADVPPPTPRGPLTPPTVIMHKPNVFLRLIQERKERERKEREEREREEREREEREMQNQASSSTSAISYEKQNVFRGFKRQPVEDQENINHDSPQPSSSTSTISNDKPNVFKGLKRQPVEDQDIYSHDSPHPSSSTSTISNDTVTDDIRLLDVSGDDVETIDKVPIKMEKIENVNDPIIIIDDDDVEMMGDNVETIDNIPIKTEKIEVNIKLENIPIKMETPSIGPCHHPKHVEYEELGLTKNSFVRITKNLAKVVGIDRGLMICRGCVKQTHHDTEYTSHQDYISPKKARKDKMLKNLKIDMFGFGTNNIPSRRKWIIID